MALGPCILTHIKEVQLFSWAVKMTAVQLGCQDDSGLVGLSR